MHIFLEYFFEMAVRYRKLVFKIITLHPNNTKYMKVSCSEIITNCLQWCLWGAQVQFLSFLICFIFYGFYLPF